LRNLTLNDHQKKKTKKLLFPRPHIFGGKWPENKLNKGLSIGMFKTNDGWCKGNISFSGTHQQCETKVSTLNWAERSENDASDVETIERLAARTLEKTTSKKSSKFSKYG